MALATPHGPNDHRYEISLEAQGEIMAHAFHAGELLGSVGVIREVVKGALNTSDPVERGKVLDEIIEGVAGKDCSEWKNVRFPRFHMAFGKFVVGRLYRTSHK